MKHSLHVGQHINIFTQAEKARKRRILPANMNTNQQLGIHTQNLAAINATRQFHKFDTKSVNVKC